MRALCGCSIHSLVFSTEPGYEKIRE
jgi:hypothetical protein